MKTVCSLLQSRKLACCVLIETRIDSLLFNKNVFFSKSSNNVHILKINSDIKKKNQDGERKVWSISPFLTLLYYYLLLMA